MNPRIGRPQLWNGSFSEGDIVLLHDQRSTGYDIRDLQDVLRVIEYIDDKAHLYILLDARLRKILLHNLIRKGNVSLLKHDIVSYPIPLEEIYRIAMSKKVDYYARFDQLSSICCYESNKDLPKTGYLTVSSLDIEEHSEYLDFISTQIKNTHSAFEDFVFILFTWQKPRGSDFGGKEAQSRTFEGEKMSMSLENIAEVFSWSQQILLDYKIALIPICVQYGNRDEILHSLEYINSSEKLRFLLPVHFPAAELVDWNSDFYEQAAFLKAVASKGGILTSIGTTIQHLGLAVGGLSQIVAVNREYCEKGNEVIDGKGVEYWQLTEKLLLDTKGLNNDENTKLKVLKQSKPHDWKSVLNSMRTEIVQAAKQICS
jgi:hypothetical protein